MEKTGKLRQSELLSLALSFYLCSSGTFPPPPGEHVRGTNLQFCCTYATLSHSATWIRLVCVFLSSSCCGMEFPKSDTHSSQVQTSQGNPDLRIEFLLCSCSQTQQIWVQGISLVTLSHYCSTRAVIGFSRPLSMRDKSL